MFRSNIHLIWIIPLSLLFTLLEYSLFGNTALSHWFLTLGAPSVLLTIVISHSGLFYTAVLCVNLSVAGIFWGIIQSHGSHHSVKVCLWVLLCDVILKIAWHPLIYISHSLLLGIIIHCVHAAVIVVGLILCAGLSRVAFSLYCVRFLWECWVIYLNIAFYVFNPFHGSL